MKKITYILLSACFLLTSCEDFLNRGSRRQGRIRGLLHGRRLSADLYQRVHPEIHPQRSRPGLRRRILGHHGYRKVVHVPDQRFVDTRPAERLVDQYWTPIYNINYFLVHMREAKGLSEATYNHYEGTARFWRAWQYFEKVKTFGCRTLVRRTDRPRRHGGALQTARQS